MATDGITFLRAKSGSKNASHIEAATVNTALPSFGPLGPSPNPCGVRDCRKRYKQCWLNDLKDLLRRADDDSRAFTEIHDGPETSLVLR